MLVGAALVAELWTATRRLESGAARRGDVPEDAADRDAAALQDATPRNAPFRIVGIGAALFPNTQAMYGFADIRTHDPMAFGRYLGLLRLLTGLETDDYFAKWSNLEDAAAELSQRAVRRRRPRPRSRAIRSATASSTTAATDAFSRTST